MTTVDERIARKIAADIGARADQVTATITLLDGGDTVPLSRVIEKRRLAGWTTRSCGD